MRTLLLASLLAASPVLAAPPEHKPPEHKPPEHKPAPPPAHGAGAHPLSGAHGGAMNQHEVHHLHKDPAAYIAAMEAPDRDSWQKPDALLSALGVARGQRIAEVGAGPGYFTRRLARRVDAAAGGWVYAADVEPKMLEALHRHLREDGLRNVTTVLCPPDDPLLPDGAADLVLIVDAYHHLAERPRYLARLQRALAPGGRIAIVDFHKRPLPFGPPMEMKLTPEEVLAEARQAGLQPLPGPAADLLPHQYVVVLGARPAAKPAARPAK